MSNETLLQLQNISVHYGGVKALDGVDVAFDEGKTVALMGPNGAGKSTILRTIFSLTPIHSGKIYGMKNHLFLHLPRQASQGG